MVTVITDYADCRALTGGLRTFEIEAANVRQLLSRIEARFPGLGQLIDQRMALAIDGVITQDAHTLALSPGCEIVLMPRIGGG
jgi:molybdopterin converting factor small subunit